MTFPEARLLDSAMRSDAFLPPPPSLEPQLGGLAWLVSAAAFLLWAQPSMYHRGEKDTFIKVT